MIYYSKHKMDHDYWTARREQHEVIITLSEEDQQFSDVVLGLVGNFHNQVLDFSPIDPPRRGGSRRGKRPNIAQNKIEGHERLLKDYFVENPSFDARMFRQRF